MHILNHLFFSIVIHYFSLIIVNSPELLGMWMVVYSWFIFKVDFQDLFCCGVVGIDLVGVVLHDITVMQPNYLIAFFIGH